MASIIIVPPNYDMEKIATDAGQPDIFKRWYHNGQLYVDDVTQGALDISLTSYETQHDVLFLAKYKVAAHKEVDKVAGIARMRYLTIVPGQEITYQEKAAEATDYVAAGYPVDTTSYPRIEAEVSATGKTASQAADDILSTRSAWIAVGASIEQERIGGKVNIASAVDISGIDAAKDTAIANLDLI